MGVHYQRCIPLLPAVNKKCSADKGTEKKDNLTRNEGSTATGKTIRKKVEQRGEQARQPLRRSARQVLRAPGRGSGKPTE